MLHSIIWYVIFGTRKQAKQRYVIRKTCAKICLLRLNNNTLARIKQIFFSTVNVINIGFNLYKLVKEK